MKVKTRLARFALREATGTESVIRIPVENAQVVEMRFSLLIARDRFYPLEWYKIPLIHTTGSSTLFEIDLSTLELADGAYEYEFIVDGNDTQPIADPYADEITRFGGYRGVFRIREGKRWRLPFSWDDELLSGKPLPNNNEMVIYEMPLRWMAGPAGDSTNVRQIGLGTFDRVIFEQLNNLEELGVNAIELLPIEDSADTLNWGYGTRFFFSPDIDMGKPVDLKFFIKRCHQRGIRVLLDVVMNHARECPLERLAPTSFFLQDRNEEPGRGEDYGGRLFRYRSPGADGHYWAREFHLQMAEYWITQYRIDGFRLDEFRGIDNWEFIQQFTDHAWQIHNDQFQSRPFIVIAEDSWRRPVITKNDVNNPNGRKVVDAMWNFAFRDEVRRLMHNEIYTQWGQPARRERITAMLASRQSWNDWDHIFNQGFDDLAQAVTYVTSHDVEGVGEQRFFNDVFGRILQQRHLGGSDVNTIRTLSDRLDTPAVQQAYHDALDQVRSAFALLMTSVGIPMFLAGEEFADSHDLENSDWRLKMSDPVDWQRAQQPGRKALRNTVSELIQLRVSQSALQRNEINFFYFHPSIDENNGERVFAYCRSGNFPLGNHDQVIVVANCSPWNYPVFDLPWPWAALSNVQEVAAPAQVANPEFDIFDKRARMSLAPFQVRVFRS